jgi:hypothetical protein
MMKCKKCGATLLMEQIPEVHISEAQAPCNQPGCDGICTYINNGPKTLNEIVGHDKSNNSGNILNG